MVPKRLCGLSQRRISLAQGPLPQRQRLVLNAVVSCLWKLPDDAKKAKIRRIYGEVIFAGGGRGWGSFPALMINLLMEKGLAEPPGAPQLRPFCPWNGNLLKHKGVTAIGVGRYLSPFPPPRGNIRPGRGL